MKKISDIYAEYKIFPGLQNHMIRVAAVASLICDNFDEVLPKNEIITACLLHDMGNIIKIKMNVIPEFFEPEGLDYWQGVKNDYIEKYGENEHDATEKIMRELGLSDNLVSLAGQNRFSLICRHRDSDDMNMKIIHYADGRVDPHGVVSYEERMSEAKERYQNHKDSVMQAERQRLIDCGREIEKQIFLKCKIKPEDINDRAIEPIISGLKDFVIK